YSTSNVELSRRRIQRLSYIETVDIKTRRLSGISDQVDLDISLTERLAGNFSIGAGFSQNQGVLFNLSLSQENFLGTGRRVSLQFDNSDVNTIYSFSYDNPFYTIDGVSRGFGLSYRQTDAREADVSDYSADQFGGNVRYGIPLTEDDSLRAGLGIENIDISTSANTPAEITSFLDANGDNYNIFSLTSSFIHDTRDRTVFTEDGNLQRFNVETTIPAFDLEYYKADYQNNHFISLFDGLTLALNGRIAYGDSYGDTTDLPFFEKFFAGGIRTVRGFDANSLGPRDSQGEPFGGDFRLVTNLELLFPPPFVEEASNTRFVVFVDAGNVFGDVGDFEFGELRASTGLGLTWITPVGALTFALARALNDEPGDELQSFQFNIGAVF
ncbi:MAG: outer membrane protein assembly factor BamA, partial [Gammaproteobacteria bacterium]